MSRVGITLIIYLIALAGFQCQTDSGKKTLQTLPPEVVESIEKRIANGVTPSMAIALIDTTGTTFFNFGKASEGGQAVDQHTVYEIGSISKAFTGVLLARQVLDGDIKLEDEVNRFLPEGVTAARKGQAEITIGHLADHTSGFPRMPDNFAPANPNNPFADYTVDQMYAFISDFEPTREVGDAYEYSNFAQGLLGHILAQNKDMNYEDLMVQVIANPLGMGDTRIRLTDSMQEHLAPGHSGGQLVENWDIPTLAGAGAIRSSAADMARFIAANLRYFESELAEAMALSHKVRHRKAGEMKVGLGWHIKEGKDGDVIWHNGGTGGYRTFVGFVKETGVGVVLLTNSSTGSDDIGFHLLDPGSKLADIKSGTQAVDVAESTLEEYVGVYELAPEFSITISREGMQLYLQATAQPRFELYAESDSLFYLTVVEAKVSFERKDGVVESLALFQGGSETQGKKVK
ncbi:CubicO group peptidase, beta-lactamase class C family [Cyclobacterium lianum]|uniref:Beta-lactamase n=1 Tax=Cyclobacterium lianum TaxID=388280 RepID=A0A1M7NZ34_9BACT|nr:serine hydrolase [Cyclobacterium lianum]SHN09332.1 CubicO group peptidase, beta-lactamase class C family [Cyclobacterium lianum]